MDRADLVAQVIGAVEAWEKKWGAFDSHPATNVAPAAMAEAIEAYTNRLEGNYPFFHPRYAGQMLKPPHPAAVAGYVGAMLINPNNHALDGGPPTAEMEKEAVAMLADMVHLPQPRLGHLTTSGTLANLEALWIARELHPEGGIAFSEEAHYTHGRMAGVLRMPHTYIPADADGRMDLDALERVLEGGSIHTVVFTAGTTARGAVDPIEEGLALARRFGCRVHIDAAYGGFFAVTAWGDDDTLSEETRRNLRAIGQCDSVAIDPHKHGLQPYGCGCVLFADPSVGRLYKHDSPYTYFTSDALHLGEISLECSRAGAAAGALWLTLQVLPLHAEAGFGPVLGACLHAARDLTERITRGDRYVAYGSPELDIVTYFPSAGKASAVDAFSAAVFEEGMGNADPLFVSLLRVESSRLAGIEPDIPQARILRSVLMKPEHEAATESIYKRLVELAASL